MLITSHLPSNPLEHSNSISCNFGYYSLVIMPLKFLTLWTLLLLLLLIYYMLIYDYSYISTQFSLFTFHVSDLQHGIIGHNMSFRIFFSEDMLIMKYSGIFLKCILFALLKDIFIGCRILGCRVFVFVFSPLGLRNVLCSLLALIFVLKLVI